MENFATKKLLLVLELCCQQIVCNELMLELLEMISNSNQAYLHALTQTRSTSHVGSKALPHLHCSFHVQWTAPSRFRSSGTALIYLQAAPVHHNNVLFHFALAFV